MGRLDRELDNDEDGHDDGNVMDKQEEEFAADDKAVGRLEARAKDSEAPVHEDDRGVDDTVIAAEEIRELGDDLDRLKATRVDETISRHTRCNNSRRK